MALALQGRKAEPGPCEEAKHRPRLQTSLAENLPDHLPQLTEVERFFEPAFGCLGRGGDFRGPSPIQRRPQPPRRRSFFLVGIPRLLYHVMEAKGRFTLKGGQGCGSD